MSDLLIDDSEIRRRRERVEQSLHSMVVLAGGGEVSEEFREDTEAYVAGFIDSHELVERARRRYGLTD